MTQNPFLNAFAALFYIACVSSLMYYGSKLAGEVESVFMPIAMLSLFVLSATIMGSLFLYQPVQMYLGGDPKGSVHLFLKTVAVFAGITVALFAIIFFSASLL